MRKSRPALEESPARPLPEDGTRRALAGRPIAGTNGYDCVRGGRTTRPRRYEGTADRGPAAGRTARIGWRTWWRTEDRWGSRGPFARAANGRPPLRRAGHPRLPVRGGR